MEEILHHVEQLEKEYDWVGAAESYEKALNLPPEDDSSRKGEIHERLGYASYRAALQAESSDDFRERMHRAVENYEKAKGFYEKMGEPEKARAVRCDALIAYSSSWLTQEPSEKKKLLDESWRLTKECLAVFDKAEDHLEYGRTYNRLLASALYGFLLEWNSDARLRKMREAVEHGERAIAILYTTSGHELVKAYIGTGVCKNAYNYYFTEHSEKEEEYKKTKAYWEKARELSKETAAVELLSDLALTGVEMGEEGSDEVLKNFEEALEYGRKTRDNLVIGSALAMLSYHSWFRTWSQPEETARLMERGLQYAEEAQCHYSQIFFAGVDKGCGWVKSPYPAYYIIAASNETDLDKRRRLARKAVETSAEALKNAVVSGFEANVAYAHGAFRWALRLLAEAEENPVERKSILERALLEANEAVKLVEQVEPLNCWDRGFHQVDRGRVKYNLVLLEKDSEKKKSMLQDAVLDVEAALKLLSAGLVITREEAPPALLAVVAEWTSYAGDVFDHLYKLTNDKEYLKKAAAAYGEAAETFRQIDLKNRVAECLWKAARVYDDSGDYLKAAQNFDLASDNYKNAAEKVPQLKEFYADYSRYMQAWSEIEKARHHHVRQEYGSAKEHFERAADIHKSLKQWDYLAPNYVAWMHIENAEELSRSEQSEEAIRVFEQAASLFIETKKSLQTRLDKIESADEKQMATGMVKATDLRHEYCTARIALEEARILDKNGDHYSSSEKYGSAAEQFEKMSQTSESEQERREMKFITTLSKAWQKMTMAEAKSSPTLYVDASRLFEQAEELSTNEKTKMLVLGHSRFCRALETGTKFADTRDQALHDLAVQHLASASNYYIKADLQTASEYAKATKLLFDAYAYMDNAEKEKDPEKKTKLYVMIERILQTSAGSYTKAEHPEKREQILKLLEQAKEEQELAASMTEALHAPSIVSATTAFASPTPTQEEAVGSERFEHADIQANLIIRQRDLRIGENLNIELELVNTGKGSALLTRVTEIIPKGFELAEKPENYRVEDSCLNLKGKRLDPLKTEELKLALKPTVRGTFSLKPTVLYLDENGKYKSHEPEPVTIIVKELGIKSWLKGEK